MRDLAAALGTRRRLRTACLIIPLALAHTPLLLLFGRGLWNRPYYQFFPFALAGVACLLWRRWPADRARDDESSGWGEATLLLLGTAALVVAVVLWSPWLGALAAYVNGTAWLVHCVGWRGLRRLLPVWAVIIFLIPPPFGWDQPIVQAPQKVTAWVSSEILDELQINHVRQGATLEFPDRELFVREAEVGLPSLPAFLAFAALFALWADRPPVWSLLLLGSSIAWYVFAEVLQVVAIAAGPVRFGVDLSSGWRYGLLLTAIYLFALILLVSTDAARFFLFAPIPLDPELTTHNPLCVFWNRRVAGRFFEMRESPEEELPFDKEPWDEDEDDEVHETREAKTIAADARTDPEAVARQRPNLGGRFWWIAALLPCALTALQLPVVLPSKQRAAALGPEVASTAGLLRSVAADLLPQDVGKWKRTDFQTVREKTVGGLDVVSRVWIYEKASHSARVSLGYPMDVASDLLADCRRGGWRVSRQTAVSEGHAPAGGNAPLRIEATLTKPPAQFGYAVCGLIDDFGKPLALAESRTNGGWIDRLERHPLRLRFLQDSPQPPVRIAIPFQVLAASNSRLSPQEQGEARALFVQLRDSVPRQWRTTSPRKARPARD